MLRSLLICLLSILALFSVARGSDDVKVTPAKEEPSDAERVADLNETLTSEMARLKELEAELADPASDYARAEKEFQELDRELEQKQEAMARFKADGKASEAAALAKEIASVEKQRLRAKDRFELALEERKSRREEITTLRRKTQLDREALDELTGTKPKSEEESGSHERGDGQHKKSTDHRDGDEADAKKSDAQDKGHESSDETESEKKSDEDDAELMAAKEEAEQKEAEAEEAREETQSIAARIADLQKLIAQEQKSLSLARKKVELSRTAQRELDSELAQHERDGAPAEKLQELRTDVAEAKSRFVAAQADVTEATDRLNDRRSELASLQSEQIVALQQAEAARLEAHAAKEKVDELRNPFTLRNITQWMIDHGPNVLLIVLAMFGLNQLAHFFSNRTIKLVASGTGRGTTVERENRARTLVGVFQNASSVAVFVGGTLMVLEEVGANITVLMGSVAAVGLAVAFGAQNLIKDYFSGFVMLLENQYMLNDTVRIGDMTGQVERITLRMTVLRDASGVVHFIPNGTINSISNETHGWSRALIEVGVAYKENVDQVIAVLTDLARQLRLDKAFGPLILEEPTVPAVDALGDSAVVLKFAIKTKPNQHIPVKREFLRRVKNRFDELGIELPFPHRTLYHRTESADVLSPGPSDIKKCA
ncbi:MAG: mechanosensitive ion channel [Planctomycetales bacterium]|nr:mechanosensitive ion channel [Planctomycetales bacterium]